MGLVVPALTRLEREIVGGGGAAACDVSAGMLLAQREGDWRSGRSRRRATTPGPSSSEACFAKTAQEVFVAAPGVDVVRCRAAGGRRLAQALDQSGQHFGGAVFDRRDGVIGHDDPMR
jgi:hypothetical protein